MMIGLTPFHSYNMQDLINKINDGRYKVSLHEPIMIETVLFFAQCLQTSEQDRLRVEELLEHPFISDEMINVPLSPLDINLFNDEVQNESSVKSRMSNQSAFYMHSRFDDTQIKDTDVILTILPSKQVSILLKHLVTSSNFTEAEIDIENSFYFNKYYNKSGVNENIEN